MRKLYNLIFIILLFCGCGSQDGQRMLDRAGTVINDDPDSALAILDCMDENHLSRSQRMKRLLLLTNAQNKCDTIFRSDSIQRILVDYYEHHGSANDRMLAHYLLGRAYYDMGEMPMALECFLKAAECADTTQSDCNYALLSRTYGQASAVFFQQNLLEEDLKYNNLSIKYAWMAKDTLCAINSIVGKIAPYKRLHQKDSVYKLCEVASTLARHCGYNAHSAAILGSNILDLVESHSLQKAKEYMDIYESQSGYFDDNHQIAKGREVYYYSKGLYYLGVEKYDSAEYFFRKELHEGKDFNNQNAGSRGLALLFQRIHQPDSAAKYALYSYAMNDSVYAHMATAEVEKMRSMYNYSRYQKLARLANERSKKLQDKQHYSILSIFLLVIVGTFILWKERQKKKNAYAQYKRSIISLARLQSEVIKLHSHSNNIEQALSQAQAYIGKMSANTKDMEDLINQKEKEIEQLQSEIQQYPTRRNKDESTIRMKIEKSDIFKYLDKQASTGQQLKNDKWQDVYVLTINAYPEFFRFISSKKYALNEKEFNTCILIRLRLRPKDICNLLGVSLAYISKIRANMMKKLFDEEGSAKEFDERICKL